MKIIEDTNGQNDLLLAPCSQETFEIICKWQKTVMVKHSSPLTTL